MQKFESGSDLGEINNQSKMAKRAVSVDSSVILIQINYGRYLLKVFIDYYLFRQNFILQIDLSKPDPDVLIQSSALYMHRA